MALSPDCRRSLILLQIRHQDRCLRPHQPLDHRQTAEREGRAAEIGIRQPGAEGAHGQRGVAEGADVRRIVVDAARQVVEDAVEHRIEVVQRDDVIGDGQQELELVACLAGRVGGLVVLGTGRRQERVGVRELGGLRRCACCACSAACSSASRSCAAWVRSVMSRMVDSMATRCPSA